MYNKPKLLSEFDSVGLFVHLRKKEGSMLFLLHRTGLQLDTIMRYDHTMIKLIFAV